MQANEIRNPGTTIDFADKNCNQHRSPVQTKQASGYDPVASHVCTGTTVVGICTEDAVVTGSDRRASLGGRLVTSKQFDKINQIHPTAVLAISGGVGGNQQFARMLRSEAALYNHRRGKDMSMRALSTVAGNVLSQYPFHSAPLLGGVDNAGSHLVSLDPAGGILQHDYAANGSGMPFAHGVLEQQYHAELSVEAATRVIARSIESAIERDTASGNGITLATITTEGVEFETHDSPSEVA